MQEKVAEKVVKEPRVVTVAKTKTPPEDRLYYGQTTEFGLREVRFRRSMLSPKGMPKHFDYVVWYEKPYEGSALIFQVSGLYKEIFDDCFYPVAIWDISNELLDDQDNVPTWQSRVVLDEENNPVYIDGQPLRAFHWIVLNTKYVPVEQPDGSSVDGLWKPGEPIIGSYIKELLNAESMLGDNLVARRRRRIGDAAESVMA